MMLHVPDDVLHLICEELGNRRDFGTLFVCATVNRSLGDAALMRLYRTQHLASVKDDSSNEAISLDEQQLVTQKWSILWRSIILSALGKTVMPYVHYIRVLDLRDLENLLGDDKFRGPVLGNFFAGELATFKYTVDAPSITREGRKRPPRLRIEAIVNAIGDLIVRNAPLLEVVDGSISSLSLIQWIPRMPNLRMIKVFEGDAFGGDDVGSLIQQNCPRFEACAMFRWTDVEADQKLSGFLSGLTLPSLRSFVTFRIVEIGPQGCLALSAHGRTLKELRLGIKDHTIPHLNLLQGCTALEILELTDNDGVTDMQGSQHEVFLEVVSWLIACTGLHTLILHGFISGAAMTTPVLLSNKIMLNTLEVSNYAAKDRGDFHKALPHQASLQKLILDGEPIEMRDDLEILCLSVCELKDLRVLRLLGVSLHFPDQHVEALSHNLEHLEELYVGGLGLQDPTLLEMTRLTQIRILTLSGTTAFTEQGFLEFISRLGPANRGLQLAIDNADPERAISEAAQGEIRARLAEAIDGRFEYTLIRDADAWDSETDSE